MPNAGAAAAMFLRISACTMARWKAPLLAADSIPRTSSPE